MSHKSCRAGKNWQTMPGAESTLFLRQALMRDDGRLSEDDVGILLGQMYQVASAQPTMELRVKVLCQHVAGGKVLRPQWQGRQWELASLDALRAFVLSVNGGIDIRDIK
jgi:hypothetical protein